MFCAKSAMIVEFISTEIMECSTSFKDASDNLTNLFTFGSLYLQIQPIENIKKKKKILKSKIYICHIQSTMLNSYKCEGFLFHSFLLYHRFSTTLILIVLSISFLYLCSIFILYLLIWVSLKFGMEMARKNFSP